MRNFNATAAQFYYKQFFNNSDADNDKRFY